MILPLRVFGRFARNSISRGATAGPSASRAWPSSSLRSALAGLEAGLQHDEGLHDLAGDRIGHADHAGLGDRRMLHQRALDLERADQVTGRLDHVVGAADEPEVAVGVAHREIAGQIPAVGEALRDSVRVFVEIAAEHRRPAGLQRQFAHRSSASRSPRSAHPRVRRTIAASTPGSGLPIEPGLTSIAAKLAIMMPPVSVCHQLSWNGTAERLRAPHDGLGVERFADAGHEAERAKDRSS